MTPCEVCQGTGEVDTGGSTPWGAWIADACPYCEGKGKVIIPMAMHPKHSVELDVIPEKFSRMGRFDGIRLNADMVNEDGIPTTIVVETNGDEHAARCIADRIRRCWNAMRGVPDDQFDDVVVCSKKNVLEAMEALHDQIDELMNPIRGE